MIPVLPSISESPLYIREGAYFPWNEGLKKSLTYPGIEDGDEIDLWFKRKNFIIVPRSCVNAKPSIKDYRTLGPNLASMKSSFVARNPEQDRVIDESVKLLLRGENHILQAHPGFGKTICGVEIANRLNIQTLIIVHKEDLANQWRDSCEKLLGIEAKDIGKIQENTVRVKRFTIAMLQSVAKIGRYPHQEFEKFGLVIFDEVHRIGARFFSQAIWNMPARLRLGMSATPFRRDGRDIVFRAHIGTADVVAKAEALPFQVIRVPSGWMCPRTKFGDRVSHSPSRTGHITKAMRNVYNRNKIICKFVVEARKKNRTVIVFSDSREHLKILEQLLFSMGISSDECAFYVGGLSQKQRDVALTKPILLATYQFCSEGTDIPWADTLILGMPRANIEQIVGRIQRKYEGKRKPTVFDIVDADSPVFSQYTEKRFQWYQSKGADIRHLKRSVLLGDM